MKVEITYIPQGQNTAVSEQYETNFYIEKNSVSFYATEKINGKFETKLIELAELQAVVAG